MTANKDALGSTPLFIARSNISTMVNKTGSWRFLRPRYDEKTAPCSAACPAGEDIARIEMLATRGFFAKAAQTILYENPFPGVCGWVCFHPCEKTCNRSEFDEPVAINSLERFLGEFALMEELMPAQNRLSDKRKKVAIAGAGPAGLAAAYFLSWLGYRCEVFEAESKPGGVLRWGIPSYRLPADVLHKEIIRIENLGVDIHCKNRLDHNFIEKAKSRFDAVFIGCGHGRSIKMKIPGEEMAIDGLGYLHRIRDEEVTAASGTAAVIGGGNTAVDVARSLVRLGTHPILVYRRRKKDMPAFSHEIDMALEEGIEIMELLAPIRIAAHSEGCILTLQRMKPSGLETSGRACVVPDGQKTQILQVQQIFTAIGAEADAPWQPDLKDHSRILKLSHCALSGQDVPVAYGGDLTNPIKSAADAVASGKQSAMALDALFETGWDSIESRLSDCKVGSGPGLSMEIYLGGGRKNRNDQIVSFKEINTDYFQHAVRAKSSTRLPEERKQNFGTIDETLSGDKAVVEASRCFNCGICNDCDNCRLFCPELAVELETTRGINLDYCKGCGICVVECPRNAMALEEEKL
jgi:NADPH-dependent glutamate synthase beta subunit-like oxidoreductase/ferredoxin